MNHRITEGDAHAILNAFGNGGRVILLRGGTAEGAPADFFGSHGSIRPFDGWDNRHFCGQDWHVILIALFGGGDRNYTMQQFREEADRIVVRFVLDGQPLETVRTAYMHALPNEGPTFGFDEAYYFQQGRIMAPGDLSVGPHQLEETSAANGRVFEHHQIEFFIDAAGTGACIG
jgi:hypothetical protein